MSAQPLAVLAFCGALIAQTAQAITIDTVRIGNPGNPADTRHIDFAHPNGTGAVAYSYNIGKTEVTNAQYVAFLNAVAATDPYGLYSSNMSDSQHGGIVRSGSPGNYSYSVKPPALSGTYPYGNKPVIYVDSGDAMRFANWLHNGQPSGAENAGTTEGGAYTLNGGTSDTALIVVKRNAGARWWLPNEDEWYKAAYHKNNGVTGDYWEFPTRTNSIPNNNPPSADTGNSANYFNNITGPTNGFTGYPLTDAGAYALSKSPYGTSDQGGSVMEWTESPWADSYRRIRGGSYEFDSTYLNASAWWPTALPSSELFGNVGFRVASVPEPSSLLLAALACGAMWSWRKRFNA